MSESIRRRSSSRQLLQNLITVTVQRSLEDAEEVERERRRRAREKERGEESLSWSATPQHNNLTHGTEVLRSDEELKPSCCLVLDEDEGFSDWSHRLENRQEQYDCRAKEQRPSQWKPHDEEEKQQQEEEEEGWEPEQRSQASTSTPMPAEKKEARRTSYSSTVFLSQDARLQPSSSHPADRTSYLAAGTMRPCGGVRQLEGGVDQKEEGVQATRQREWRSAETTQKPTDEEEPSFTNEEKRGHRGATEEQRMSEEGSMGDRDGKGEDTNRRSAVSLSSSDGDEQLSCYGPMSPTFKKLLIQFYPDEVKSSVSPDSKCMITERTESLRKSTNVMKKTPPPLPISRIDKRLQQYTHAVEDADSLTIGAPDLINQWVRGREEGSGSRTPSKPAEIKPGDVLNKKNLWESFSDTCSPGREGKEISAGKRYKFVVTGHGKYEKVSADHDSSEDANWSALQLAEDL
ncbi:uncharacterized protein ACBR49_003209 [Aulostomus maculatus]